MAAHAILKEGARGLLTTAARDGKAVKRIIEQCAKVDEKELPARADAAAAAVAQAKAAMGNVAAPDLGYNDADGFMDDGGDTAEIVIGRAVCWRGSDVTVKLHFARQAFRHAARAKSWAFFDALRKSEAWQTVRIGMAVYGDLLRIGMTGKRLEDMVKLAQEVGGVEGQNFLTVAVGGTDKDKVVPSGLGVMEPIVKGIEDAYEPFRKARQKMTERLPQPKAFAPRNREPLVRRACFNCDAPSDDGPSAGVVIDGDPTSPPPSAG